MNFLATVTSKRQLTIPVGISKKIGLSEGDKVLVREEKGQLIISPAYKLVNQIAGSVTIPEKLKGINPDQAITKAKEKYFKNKNDFR